MIEIKPTNSAGCSGKASVFELRKMMEKTLSVLPHESLFIGANDHDDAAVVDLAAHEKGVLTVDFIHSPVRDPYLFGRLATAHALNDIYAMGAIPHFGLTILGGPSSPHGVMLNEIMRGVSDVALEDELSIVGGHTLITEEPICGLAVLGNVTKHIWRNNGCKQGDLVFLSKPIGAGLMLKEQNALANNGRSIDPRLFQSDGAAAKILRNYEVTSASDISGFGLRYQLGLMATKSGVSIDIMADHIPIYSEAINAFSRGIRLGAVCENGDYFGAEVVLSSELLPMLTYFLDEPQTNGPLLFSLPAKSAQRLLEEHPSSEFSCIGQVGLSSTPHLVNIH